MAELTPDQKRIQQQLDERTKGAETGLSPKPEKPAKPAKKASTLSFDYRTMVKQSGFDVSGKVKPFKTPKGKDTKVPDFITGGTAAQKKALARKIANLTIDSKTMSAADIAKIKKARLWYTGQTKGGGKKQPATYTKGSVKEKLMGPAPKPSKDTFDDTFAGTTKTGVAGTTDKKGRTVVNENGVAARKGYYFDEDGRARPIGSDPIGDADKTARDTADWLANGNRRRKRN